MEKIGPIEKVYKAYSAIADGRVRIAADECTATVASSDRQKTYTVTWTANNYTSNDNASYSSRRLIFGTECDKIAKK